MAMVEHRERLCRFGFEYVAAALAGRVNSHSRALKMASWKIIWFSDVTEVMTSRLCAALRQALGEASCEAGACGQASEA